MDGTSVTALLQDLLFQPSRVSVDAIAARDPRTLAAAADRQQVIPQVLAAMRRIEAPAIAEHIGMTEDAARQWALYEALERDAVRAWLDRVDAPVLFFKGAALAYGVYETPSDRMRMDWDVLVREADATAAQESLRASGFEPELAIPLGPRRRQVGFRKPVGAGECGIDLHVALFNAPSIAARITFDDLWSRRKPLASLHANAFGPDDADGLALACVHRLVHHSGDARLVWDCDIRALVTRVEASGGGLHALVERSAQWEIGPLVAVELTRVARVGEAASPRLDAAIDRLAAQPSAFTRFATPNRSRGDDLWIDMQTAGWRARLAYAREVLFPPASFLRASSGSRLPLPVLYARRIARGALRWLSRPRSNRPSA